MTNWSTENLQKPEAKLNRKSFLGLSKENVSITKTDKKIFLDQNIKNYKIAIANTPKLQNTRFQWNEISNKFEETFLLW